MIKFLIQLVFVIFLSIMMLITVVSEISITIVENVTKITEADLAFTGSLELLKDTLVTIPKSKRLQYLVDNKENLGFTVTLKNLPDFTQAQQAALNKGEKIESYSLDIVAIKLPDENRVVCIDISTNVPEHLYQPNKIEQVVLSDFFLVSQRLSELPSNQWQSYLATVNQAHSATISVITKEQVPNDLKTVSLRDNSILLKTEPIPTALLAEESESFYQQLKHPTVSNLYLRMGSVSEAVEELYTLQTIVIILVYIFFLLLPILLWLFPTWLNLRRLTLATNDFANGNLDARTKKVFGSNLNSLSKHYNKMADSIQRLFNSHKMMTMAVSHDLRTPLSRLEFAMEMMRKSPQNAEKQLGRMQTAVDDLSKLVSEVLLHASLDRDSETFEFERFDGKKWLNTEMEQWQFNHPNLSIYSQYIGDKTIEANAYYLKRVLLNLMSNACKFAKTSVNVTLQSHQGCYKLVVQDNGKGIDPDYLETIFQPFETLDSSRNLQSGGTGLGLAIVKLVAERHNGDITVHNRNDCGGKIGAIFTMIWKKPINEKVD